MTQVQRVHRLYIPTAQITMMMRLDCRLWVILLQQSPRVSPFESACTSTVYTSMPEVILVIIGLRVPTFSVPPSVVALVRLPAASA